MNSLGSGAAAVVFLVILPFRFFAILASRLVALGVEVKCVLLNDETAFAGDSFLPAFDFFVNEFLDTAAVDAYEVVVMRSCLHFEHSFAGFEMVPLKEAGFLKLGQDAINRGEPDVDVVAEQLPVNIVRAEVAYFGLFEEFEDSEARQGRFKTHALEFTGSAHNGFGRGRGHFSVMIYRHFDPDYRDPFSCDRSSDFLPVFLTIGTTGMTFSRLISAVFLFSLLAGCSSVPRIVNEYKIDVQQGNVLTQDMVAQLRPGLSREQVRFILGTPMLQDMFHANRWDYVYTFKEGSTGVVEMRKFSTFFDANNRLVRVSGDVTGATPEDASKATESRMREIDLGSISGEGAVPPLEDKGFFSKMLEKVGF